jgi:hypothetical protein
VKAGALGFRSVGVIDTQPGELCKAVAGEGEEINIAIGAGGGTADEYRLWCGAEAIAVNSPMLVLLTSMRMAIFPL